MAKYRDTNGMGKSKMCPKKKGELPKERHNRRKLFSKNFYRQIAEFCQQHQLSFMIKNYGHHWSVWKGSKVVEWWPSSAKVVVNKHWKKGIHCHDYSQFIEILTKQFKLLPLDPRFYKIQK